MATVNAQTLDTVERIQFFRLNRQGVLETLPFAQSVVDHDLAFYEPQPLLPSGDGARRRGTTTGQVVLAQNRALPVTPAGQRVEAHGVWFYAGV